MKFSRDFDDPGRDAGRFQMEFEVRFALLSRAGDFPIAVPIWRNVDGQLECGLLDWGCVGQMNAGMALWGALCSAETSLWDHHLDELLALFAAEFHDCGGPQLDIVDLRHQLLLYAAIMGITWLLDVPAYLSSQLPPHVPSRTDPRVADSEPVRSRLLMLTNFLNLWQTTDFGAVLGQVLR